ncbi:MAG: hypothetical protein JST17_01485 [Bacteroidetes bacterium]|nr:hypothetical protein [Bacteroidota bacterium]MBS1931954.1 hypothetical protein [Bacteroidota bacterium]
MHQKPLLKSVTSLLLLLIFAFSITPKQWIHEWVFQHKDVYTRCTDGSFKTHLHQSGFHCELDNIVVLSPFISEIASIESNAPLVHSVYYSRNIITLNSNNYFFFDLRGPPAMG